MLTHESEGDRRTEYRVHPHGTERIRIIVTASGQDFVADAIVDASAGGVAIIFDSENQPLLAQGERARVTVASLDIDERVEMDAVLVAVRGDQDQSAHSFQLSSAEPALRSAYSNFFGVFNRRSAFRGVKPNDNEPFSVSLKPAGGMSDDTEFRADVENLSVGGICVSTDFAVHNLLAHIDEFELSLRLPETSNELHLGAIVRYRGVSDESVLYGFQFNPDSTPQYSDQAEQIRGYILRRFQDEISAVMH